MIGSKEERQHIHDMIEEEKIKITKPSKYNGTCNYRNNQIIQGKKCKKKWWKRRWW